MDRHKEVRQTFRIFLIGLLIMTFTGSIVFYVSPAFNRPLVSFSAITMLHMGLAVILFPVFVDGIGAEEVLALTTIISIPVVQMVLSTVFPYDVSKYGFNEVFKLVLILMMSLCGSVGIGYLTGAMHIRRNEREVER